jgi:hypothetical protein
VTRFAGDRLLSAQAPASGNWADAEWAYAVPLANLETAEALRAEIAEPVTASLLLSATPEKALAATGAVAWRP